MPSMAGPYCTVSAVRPRLSAVRHRMTSLVLALLSYTSYKKSMKNRKSQSGFTLIELLITMALIAIFAVIAVPSYPALTADNQVISALNDFANALGGARAEAVARGQTVIVCPSSNATTANPPTCNSQTMDPQEWDTGWISFVDKNGNDQYDAGTDTVLRVHGPIANGVTLKSQLGGGAVSGYIGFNRMGFASPTFSQKTSLVVHACAAGTGHVRGGSLTLVLAGTLSTNSGGC